VIPSGQALAQAMAEQVEPGRGLVLELGAGTGAITRALLARGLGHGGLVLVEKDPRLAERLALHFPQERILRGDAGHLKRLLVDGDIVNPATVVSSLPLLSLPNVTRLRVLSQIFSLLKPGGKLVQFTYSPLPPISDNLAKALGVFGERVARVRWNLPPATVWVYARQAGVQ
jgi:phosphatidylethanolamine/phosphatidyl-N-methylethanolamine N-methyltransferase